MYTAHRDSGPCARSASSCSTASALRLSGTPAAAHAAAAIDAGDIVATVAVDSAASAGIATKASPAGTSRVHTSEQPYPGSTTGVSAGAATEPPQWLTHSATAHTARRLPSTSPWRHREPPQRAGATLPSPPGWGRLIALRCKKGLAMRISVIRSRAAKATGWSRCRPRTSNLPATARRYLTGSSGGFPGQRRPRWLVASFVCVRPGLRSGMWTKNSPWSERARPGNTTVIIGESAAARRRAMQEL